MVLFQYISIEYVVFCRPVNQDVVELLDMTIEESTEVKQDITETVSEPVCWGKYAFMV